MNWTVIIPIKAVRFAKSRLAVRTPELVLAIGDDTIAAVQASPLVDRVIVVTDEPGTIRACAAWPEKVVRIGQRGALGLNASLMAAVAEAGQRRPGAPTAIVLGDLPALRTSELTNLLREAEAFERCFLADAAGTGTTVLAARSPAHLVPHFGGASANAHHRHGYTRLAAGRYPSLERDIDVDADLDEARKLGLGVRTSGIFPGSGAARAS